MKFRVGSIIVYCMALVLLAAAPSWAHKVNIYGYAEDGKLKGQAYFAGGNPARESKVLLLDNNGKEIDGATTGVDGSFEMALPTAKPPLKLVIAAGEGHQGEFTLLAEDLGQAAEETASTQSNEATTAAAPATPPPADFEKAVAKIVEKKVAPLRAEINRIRAEQPSQISQVVGGIGWIIGLVGVAAFFLARRRIKE